MELNENLLLFCFIMDRYSIKMCNYFTTYGSRSL